MSLQPDAIERRTLRSIARRYRREGYRVTLPGQGAALPAFLDGFAPDLIAENDRDHVVVEIRRSDAVRGANDLVGIAERVSGKEGWRFELVALEPPAAGTVPGSERLAAVEARVRRAVQAGLADLAYAYAFSSLEEVLADLALRHGLDGARMPAARALRDLVSLGILSEDDRDRIGHARTLRNRLLHGGDEALPSAADVEAVLALAHRLSAGAGR